MSVGLYLLVSFDICVCFVDRSTDIKIHRFFLTDTVSICVFSLVSPRPFYDRNVYLKIPTPEEISYLEILPYIQTVPEEDHGPPEEGERTWTRR